VAGRWAEALFLLQEAPQRDMVTSSVAQQQGG